jgi:hypothetical protein
MQMQLDTWVGIPRNRGRARGPAGGPREAPLSTVKGKIHRVDPKFAG